MSQRTILIVDDSLEDAATVRRYLALSQDVSYRILEAASGEAALECLRHETPDCILLDFRLPDIDGLALLALLKAKNDLQRFPVVMLTGKGSAAVAVRTMQLGGCDYLAKAAVNEETLLHAIDNAIEKHVLHQRLETQREALQRNNAELEAANHALQLRAKVMENINDALLVTEGEPIDPPGPRILYVNPAFERLTGYTSAEVVGQTPRLFHWEKTNPQEMEQIRAALQRLEPVHVEVTHYHRDGTLYEAEVDIIPLLEGTGRATHVISIQRDVTERKRAEVRIRQLQAEAQAHAQMLETTGHLALDILSSQTGTEALRHIADAARKMTQARYAALGVAHQDGEGMLEFVTVGMTPEEEARIGPRPKGAGILGLLISQTEPLRVDTLALHPASSGFPPHHPPMDSFLGVPIRQGDTVLGSLYLTNKESGNAFTDADEAAVQALGDYAAVAIHNWHLLARQRALLRGVILAQEEERRAVAYDLHDGLTQYVMASFAHLNTAASAQETGNAAKATREMKQGLDYLQHAVLESRRLVNGLRALVLDELGLAGALEQLLNEEKMRAGWHEAHFLHNVEQRRYDVLLETTVYRIAQEALTNARKHARTNRIRITLLREETTDGAETLCLEIRDWGVGFVPEEKLRETERVGLHSMGERVGVIGGTYTLHSVPGEGTLIRAVFPALTPQGTGI